MKKTEQPIGKVGTYAYQTEVYSLDFRGRLTIPTLGDYLFYMRLHAMRLSAATVTKIWRLGIRHGCFRG